MGDFFSKLLAKLSASLAWIGDLFASALTAVYSVFKDAFSWVFDSLLGVAVSAISAVDVSGISAYTSGSRNLPAEILNVLSLLGVGEAISIIVSALLIRMTLQLIPFVRLGS